MNSKKKLIGLSLLLVITIIGIFFKFHNNHNKTISSNSRVIQIETHNDKKDSKLDKDKKEKDAHKNKKIEKQQSKKEKNEKELQKQQINKEKKDEKITSLKTKLKDNREIGNRVTVNIRIEGYDRTFLPRTKITTGNFNLNPYLGVATGSSSTASKGWNVDKFKEVTNAHAIVKALNNLGYKKGIDYDLQDYGWGLYMAMIGGNREFDHRGTSGWMYRVNNVLPNIGCQGKPIQNEDEILWYFGVYGFDTLVTEIKTNKCSAKIGETVTITLNGIKNDINTWKEYREPAKGAIIYSNGKPLNISGRNFKTDNKGQTAITFDKAGTYHLSAERVNKSGLKDIVRPRPIVITVK